MDETREEVALRAERIYEERIRALVEREHFGKVISIDVKTGDFEIAEDRHDRMDAVHRLRGRHEQPRVFSLKIGGGPVARIGGARRVGVARS